jgi:hypothetical protein
MYRNMKLAQAAASLACTGRVRLSSRLGVFVVVVTVLLSLSLGPVVRW